MTTKKSRSASSLRPTSIEKFDSPALASVIITMGNTRVLCCASSASELPDWLKNPKPGTTPKGWVTAEYAMLPGSTPQRKKRGTDGRATEIQRLIARALRAAVDLEKMPSTAITVDCDVLVADGGTRTASITGGCVALALALEKLRAKNLITEQPFKAMIAAVSVGVVDGKVMLDLDYPLDSRADVDMNVVMNDKGRFIEVQGTGEASTFSAEELDAMLKLAQRGIGQLLKIQKEALQKLV